jgi:hypothetical protein
MPHACRGLGKGLGVVKLGLNRLVSELAHAAERRAGGERATCRSAGEGGDGGRAREFRVFVADDRVQRMSLPAFLARRCSDTGEFDNRP